MANDNPRALTLREAVEEKVGSWLGLPGQTPAERLMASWRKRRTDWRAHWHSYVAVNGGLFALNGLLGLISGSLFPWFLFPAVGWGIALAIHTLGYRAWIQDHRAELEAASRTLGIPFAAPVAALPEPAVSSRDARWIELLARCREAARRAEAGMRALPGQARGVRQQLRAGLDGVEKLAAGAERIQGALAQLDGTSLDAEIAAVDRSLAAATDDRLREVQRANRALLVARREKVSALRADHDRMYANAQGFSLALENLALDAARLGQGDALEPLALSEPIARLKDEVRILGEVEAEIRKLP